MGNFNRLITYGTCGQTTQWFGLNNNTENVRLYSFVFEDIHYTDVES